MSTTTVSPTTTKLDQALEALLSQGQQTNQVLQSLVQEMRVMNEQLFGQRAGMLMNPYTLPANGHNGHNGTAPARPDPQAPQERKVERGTCAEVGISKTRSLNKWKVIFYMYGLRKPAAIYGHGGYKELMRFMGQVWPGISEDHFSEELFNQRNKEARDANPDATYIARYTVPEPFTVEFYDSAPTELADGRQMSFRYADRVYPKEA